MRKTLLLFTFALAAHAATVGATDSILPLIYDGGGWSTQITVVNLSNKPASIIVSFLTPTGFNPVWTVVLKSTAGKVVGNLIDLPLAPGATAVIDTSGAAATLTRGFAELVELGDQPIGATAVLTQREGDRVLQRLQVPLSPVHERRSVMSLDLSDPTARPELVWVSLTSSATLDLIFRNLAGDRVLTDQVTFDERAQVFVRVRDQWPQLKDFRGTMQWTVTFPTADRYEPRILAGLCLLARDNQPWQVLPGMTLLADQGSSSPY